MKKHLLFFILLILFLSKGKSQNFSASLNMYPGIVESFSRSLRINYTGLSVDFQYPVRKLTMASGITFRSIHWGSQLSFDEYIYWPLFDKDGTTLKWKSGINLSFPLFYNKQLLGFGASSGLEVRFKRMKRIGFYGGARFNSLPGYRELSRKSSFFEGEFGIRLSRR